MLLKVILLSLLYTLPLFSCSSFAESWSLVRNTEVTTGVWQPVVCEAGSGWRSCQVKLTVVLSSDPSEIVANGSTSIITANVFDYFGNPVESGIELLWSTSKGSLERTTSYTSASGSSQNKLISSNKLEATEISAKVVGEEGAGTLTVNFIDKWIPTTASFTAWVNSGGVYGCSNWSPSPSTINQGQTFTQTATDCFQNQVRNRQEREISVVTGNIKNNGSPVLENRTLTSQVLTRSATGTKPVSNCAYDPAGMLLRLGGAIVLYAGPGYFQQFNAPGATTILSNNGTSSSITSNGVTYYRGSYKRRTPYNGSYGEYEICWY